MYESSITLNNKLIFDSGALAMTREDYIGFCRYYNGEDECPKGVRVSFWEYERSWVDMSMSQGYILSNMIDDYIAYGLANFEVTDNAPMSLKAVLFNKFSHWSGCDTEGFKRWYKKEYLRDSDNV